MVFRLNKVIYIIAIFFILIFAYGYTKENILWGRLFVGALTISLMIILPLLPFTKWQVEDDRLIFSELLARKKYLYWNQINSIQFAPVKKVGFRNIWILQNDNNVFILPPFIEKHKELLAIVVNKAKRNPGVKIDRCIFELISEN